jgi:hypothetical protein
MTEREVADILKESNLWAPLTEREKQEVIRHALRSIRPPVTEGVMEDTVGEVYLGS